MTCAAREADRYVSVASIHMPTSWHDKEVWMNAFARLGDALEDWRRRGFIQVIALAGDMGNDLSATASSTRCPRSSALAEFCAKWDVRDMPGCRKPMRTWRHPGSGADAPDRRRPHLRRPLESGVSRAREVRPRAFGRDVTRASPNAVEADGWPTACHRALGSPELGRVAAAWRRL